MANYAPDHAAALADVADAGADADFTFENPGTLDEATGLYTSASTTTVSGKAIQTKGESKTYDRLGLKQSEAPTLFWVPDTLGQLPLPDYRITWGSRNLVVRDVDPIAPDGTALAARVVVSR
jgi:hypothetical protein